MSQFPTIRGDVPCIQCGYNLRGLPEAAACPECGTPVANSLRGDRLQFASPEYLATLVRGAKLVWWSVALLLLMIIFSVVLIPLRAALRSGGPFPAALLQLIPLVSTVMGLVGWWLLSTPDPAAELDRGRASQARAVLRGALVISACCTLLNFVGAVLVVPTRAAGGPSAMGMLGILVAAGSICGGIAGLVHAIAANFYVQYLAARIPDDALARRARAVLWAAGVALGLAVLGVISLLVPFIAVTMMCGVAVTMLIVCILYIAMIDKLKSSLVGILTAR